MRRTFHPLTIIVIYSLAVVFFSGCAAGPASNGLKSTKLTPAQKASEAAMAGDYKQSVRLFDAIRDTGQEIPAEHLYDYGLSLNQTGRHEEALQPLTEYVDSVDRRLDNYQAALSQMNLAEQKIQGLRQQEERIATREANLSGLEETININSQQVQRLLNEQAAAITEPLSGMEMLLIQGNCYKMGDQSGAGKAQEKPVHDVCVDSFYLGRYEVTQAQWLAVMGYNPSQDQQGGQYPVDSISWQEAMDFAKSISGNNINYRLPTEAEWEYAARSGGQNQKFSGGDNADLVAWHMHNSGGSSQPVGQKKPNGLGLYDMSGNLYEWCLDRYSPEYYQKSPVQNPTGAVSGTERAQRGGSWGSKVSYSRTTYRTSGDENNVRSRKTGFRVALPVTP